MHIENRREESEFGRVTREWWECRDCRTEFRALAPQPSAQPQERVSEAVREVLSRCEDFRRNPSASGTANATFEHIAQILTAARAPSRRAPSGDGGGENG
jgi:hypothetical protein